MPDILNRPTTAEERRDASVAARQKAQYQKWDKRAQEADQSTWTVVTSSGDSYELSTAQVEWIRSRYKVNWEYDDSSTVDSYNKSRGYMPSNTLSTYNNTEYDKVLYESGLPSSSNLADYINQYNEYYSLTSGQLQLSDDVAAWIRDRYKQDWEYDSLDSDDTKRQKNGEMPVSLDGNYANTNLDDYLRLQGLPSYANMQKYIDYYNEYVSANRPNEFYQDVWVSYNNLELIGIQNTDDILTSDQIGAYAQASGLSAAEAAEMLRSGITGAELYSKAFYDPLSGEYADIADRLISPQKPSDDDDDDGIGVPAYDDAQKILDEQKAEARREKAASGKTVDYDYFMENFDSFGDTSQILSNGMTLEEGLTSARTFAAQEAENAVFAAFDEKADVDDYVRQNADLGYSELLERFYAQYAAGNVSWAYVRRAKNQLLKEASKEDRAAIRALWDDIQSRKKDEDVRLNVGGEGFFGAGKLGRAQAYISAKYEEYDPSGMMPDMTAETLNTIYNDLLIQGASEATIQAFSKQMSALLPEDSEAAIENAKWTNSTSSQMRATANKNLKLFSEDYFSDNEATSEGLLQVATEAWDKANIDGSVTVDEAMAIFQNAVADRATTEQLDELAASLGFVSVGQVNPYGSSDVGLGGDDTLGVSYYPIGSTKTDWTSTERLAFHEQYYALRDGAEMVSNAKMIRAWLVQIESSEAMSPWQAFQTVSRAGYGDVLSTYFADEWNRAYFTEKIVPSLVGASNSELADWWLDSETTDEDRLKFAQDYYNQLSAEEREAYSLTNKSNSVLNVTYQYKLNPDVNKSLPEQIGAQIGTIIPKVFSGIASGTVGLADLMFGWIGQDKRDGDLWQLTKDLQQFNADITNYGRSTSQGTGARLVSAGSDVVSEIIRMYLANYAGKALGGATGLSTKASKEGASALTKIAAYAVESAPFVSEAMGNYFIEAYQGGASRGEAMAYGVVLGTLEGAIEKLNVDSWLGKRMGSSSFGKTILAGTNTKGMSVVAKAKLASLVTAFLGEFAEEDISYIASTIWQSAGYGRQEGESFGKALSRQWSWSELFEQGVMGGLVGLFGAGVSLGGITSSSILTDYMVENGLSSEQMDLLYALTSWDSMSTAEQVAFSERAVKSLSLEDYNGTYQNYKDTTNAIEKAPVTLQSAIASESRKVANKQNIVDALVTEQSALGAVESLSTEDLQRWSALAGNLATAQGELNTQLEQSRAAVATAQATYKATMTNAQAQNTASYNKLKEHYAATAMAFSGDIEAIRTSLAATRIKSETTGKAKDLLDALNNNYLAPEFSNLSDADIDAFIAQSIESSDLNSTLASAQVASATAKARLDSLNARLNLMKGSTTVVDVADASVLEAKEAEQRKAARAEAVSDKTSAESDVKEDISSEASKTPSEAKTSSDKEMPATRSKAEIDSPETIEAAIVEGKAFVGDTGTKYKRVSSTNEDKITRAGKKLGRSVVWENADYHKSGWYAGDNTLHLNRYQPESEAILSPQMIVFRHELTHSLEGTKQYEAYKRNLLLLIDRIAARQGKPDTRTVIASMISERATLAEQMNDSTLRLTTDAAEREIVASYLNKMALSDETFIKRLVRASDIGLRGLAGRMLNRISFAIQRFGRNNADKLLIEAEQMYLAAFRAKLKQEKTGSVDKSGEMFDEDGALIPASERLDDTTNDTHYSTGLTYDQLVQRYGAKRQGMDPRREDVQVPERTEVGRVPDLARTVLESQQYSESILGDVKDAIAAGEILSDTVSLKSSAQRARQEIKEAGAGENAASALHKASNDLQTTLRGVVGRKNLSNTIAKTAQLLAEFSKMNDGAAFMDLLMATMEYSSEVGRALNAHKLFKLTGAKGAQYYAVKMAQQGNNIINELNEKTRRQEESRLRRKYANVDFGSDADADVGEGTGTGAGTDGTGNGTGDGTGAGTDAGTRTGAYAGTDTRTGTRTRAANQSGDMSAMERAIRRDLDAYMQQYGNLPIVVPMELFDALTKAEGNDQATADAVDNLLRAIGAQLPLTAMDKVNNWRYFAMLSNPVTHARNIAGNIAMIAAVASKDVIASGLEKAAVRMGLMDDTERTHAAYSRNAQVDRVEAAKVLFERQRAEPWLQEGRYNYKSMLAKYKRSFDAKWLDALATFNDTALDKEDLFFSKRAFIDSATQFMVAQDLSADLSTWDEATLESVVNHAATESLKAVFRQPSEFARALQLFENSGSAKLFKQIAVESTIPFKKTPINIGKTMIAYSPLSILQGVYSATMNIIKKSDGGYVSASTVCDQFAKGIVGSALSAVGFLLASLGVLHGAFSDDEDEYMKALGYSEYSLTFGDVNIKINSIVPFSAPLFMGAMLYELAARDANESVDFGAFFDTALSVFDPIADLSFMSSINSVLEAYGYNGWGGVLGEMGSSITSQFLPSIGANTTRALEYTSRSTKASAASPLGGTLDYWWRSLARKLPLVSSAVLEPTVDIHGDVVQKDEFSDWALGFANAYLLPTSTTIANKNSIDEEIISVYRNTGNTGVLPASPRKYFTSDKVRYNLTASQYTEYSEEYGTYVYDQIANLIRKAKYKNADYDKKARLLADCISDAEDYIRDKWKAKIIED